MKPQKTKNNWRQYCYIVFCIIFLAACGGGGGGAPASSVKSDENSSPPPSEQTGTVSGQVVNYNTGEVIPGATVSSSLGDTITGSDGRFTLNEVTAGERSVINAHKEGFAEQSIIVSVTPNQSQQTAAIKMLPADLITNFDPTSAQNLSPSNSNAAVILNANTLIDENGNLPSTDVTVNLTIIDPSSDPDVMPGDFSENSTGSLGSIESFGAVNITFSDQGGNALNLAESTTATVRIPVANNVTNPAPTIPLYYYDQETGLWVEEGIATLNGNFYEGQVAHFSTWNCDDIMERAFIEGCVVDENGDPLARATVKSQGLDYNGTATVRTRNDGTFKVPAKSDAQALVYAQYSGERSNSQSVFTPGVNQSVQLEDCLVFGEESITITLSWGQDPSDLDSYLYGPDFTIYYGNKGALDNTPYAQLDVDDTSSYGPEVITVSKLDNGATYSYGVHHYSGSSTITQSPTRVELNINGELMVFTPSGSSDRYWHAFDLVVDNNGNITVNEINTFLSSTP